MNPIIGSNTGIPTVPVSMAQPVPGNVVVTGSTVQTQPMASTAFAPANMGQPVAPIITPQPVYPQPTAAPANGMAQAGMYQGAYQTGGQPIAAPVVYTPHAYGPVNPMPTELAYLLLIIRRITKDLVFVLSWRSCMIVLLVLNVFLFLGSS